MVPEAIGVCNIIIRLVKPWRGMAVNGHFRSMVGMETWMEAFIPALRKGNLRTDDTPSTSQPLSLASIQQNQLARQQKRLKGAQSLTYRDTSHVIPTSNLVERSFSNAKHVLTDDRKRMEPRRLEEVLYLRYKRAFERDSRL